MSGSGAIWRRWFGDGRRRPAADDAASAGGPGRATLELIISKPWAFDVFRLDGRCYMSVLTGGVGQYRVTVKLTEAEVEAFDLCAHQKN